ncbi:MAG: hypothetical protein IIA90_03915, partial [Chloroflexi bacterium]|nr:hypothetical protein [Chloroflexota bacterium]
DAMNRLTSVKAQVSGRNEPYTVLYEAPDRSQTGYAAGEWSRCVAGSRVWRRQIADDGTLGSWTLSEEATTEWRWPDYDRAMGKAWSESEIRVLGASGVEEFLLLEETEFAGEEVWVITYDYSAPTIEGPVPVRITEWIAKETHWLLKVDHWQDDPFGFTGTTTTVYSRYNEPQDIECPVASDDGEGA